MKPILALCLLASLASAEDKEPPKPEAPTETAPTLREAATLTAPIATITCSPVMLKLIPAESLTICTEKGDVVISYKTGAVTYPSTVDVDEAARVFWEAVRRAAPKAFEETEKAKKP